MSHNNLWGLSHQGSVIGYIGSSDGAGLGYYIPWIGRGQKIGLRLGGIYRNSSVVEYGSLENERMMIYEEGSMKQWDGLATITVRPGLYNYAKIRLTASNLRKTAVSRAITPKLMRATNGGPSGDTKSMMYPSRMMINRGIKFFST